MAYTWDSGRSSTRLVELDPITRGVYHKRLEARPRHDRLSDVQTLLS